MCECVTVCVCECECAGALLPCFVPLYLRRGFGSGVWGVGFGGWGWRFLFWGLEVDRHLLSNPARRWPSGTEVGLQR